MASSTVQPGHPQANRAGPDWRTLVRFIGSIREGDIEKVSRVISDLSVENQVVVLRFASVTFPHANERNLTELMKLLSLHERSSPNKIIEHTERLVLYETVKGLTKVRIAELQKAIKDGDSTEVEELLDDLSVESILIELTQPPELIVNTDILLDNRKLRLFLSEIAGKIISGNPHGLGQEHLVELCAFITQSEEKQTKFLKTLNTIVSAINGLHDRFEDYILIGFEGTFLLGFIGDDYFLQFLNKDRTLEAMAMLIALQPPKAACHIASVMRTSEVLSEKVKQEFSILALTYCTSIGISHVDVIETLLFGTQRSERLEGTVRSLIINAKRCNIQKSHMAKLLQHVSLFHFLTSDKTPEGMDNPEYLNAWVPFPDTDNVSLIKMMHNGKLDLTDILADVDISGCLHEESRSVSTQMLDMFQPFLLDYFIPESSKQAKLQMYGAVLFNEFRGNPDFTRNDAAEEAETITQSLREVGIDVKVEKGSWSSEELITELRMFCKSIRLRCSLVVVCIMSHGNAGILYGCGGLTDTASGLYDKCRINDILYTLGVELPPPVPKLIIIQACQDIRVQDITRCKHREKDSQRVDYEEIQDTGAPPANQSMTDTAMTDTAMADTAMADTAMADTAMANTVMTDAVMTDARRGCPGVDDTHNLHIELTYPNMTLLSSTKYGDVAYRNHFLPALAEEIRGADFERTVHDMFIDASHKMSLHTDRGCSKQIPVYQSSNRKRLIIPGPRKEREVDVVYRSSQACTIL